jgi:hypothetical protein
MVVLSKMPISIHGHPGREINFESQAGSKFGKSAGRTRVFLVGPRLYQVLVAGPPGRLTPETIEGFLNSFELLDQGAGPAGPGIPPGPPPAIARPSAAPPRPATVRKPPDAPPGPAATPGFYSIPEPATAAIEADVPGMGATTGNAEIAGLGGPTTPAESAGGATIRSFEWADEDADLVGGYGDAARPDGTKDQHLRLQLELPQDAIIESLTVTSGPPNRWVTQPSDRYWPIAIFQDGRAVSRSYVAQVGAFSGPQAFDLYINTGIGPGPGSPIDLEVILSIDGRRATLSAHCKRPRPSAGPLAAARPPQAAPGRSPTPPTLAPVPDATPAPQPPDPTSAGGETAESLASLDPSGGEPTEVPTSVKPSDGGATIISFGWMDQDDDRVGTSGRQIRPGGGKDEHYQLVMDLPAAAIIEEITITGGGVLRWTTKPSARCGPVAVVVDRELKNRGQSLRVGAFSGRWTFDLYVESHGSVRPDQVFGVEVVVFIRGARHHLTARCQRK